MLSSLPSSFWQRVDQSGDCWQWIGVWIQDGYGRFRLNGKNKMAHRVTFEAMHGPVPEGLQLDHLCRNRLCVNPAHLEIVTPHENWRRGQGPVVGRQALTATWMRRRLQTVCKNGHSLDNAVRRKSGHRQCRACLHLAQQRWRHNHPEYMREYLRRKDGA